MLTNKSLTFNLLSFFKEPALTPILIAVLCFFAAFKISKYSLRLFKFPGLILILFIPLLIASIANGNYNEYQPLKEFQ